MALWLPCVAWAADLQPLLDRADAVRSSDPAQFEALLSAIDAAEPQATQAQREHIRLLRAYFTAVRGEMDHAATQAENLFATAQQPTIRFRAGMLAANTEVITRDFPEALRYLDQALAQMDSVTDEHTREEGQRVAATVYNLAGRYQKGLDHARSVVASPLSEKSLCVARHLEVEALLHLGQPAEDAYVQGAIAQCAIQGDLVAAGLLRRDLAIKWAGEGRTADAVSMLERHWSDVETTRYPLLAAITRALIADYRLQLGDVAGAHAQARTVHAMPQLDPHSLPIITAHRVLYEVAKRRGDAATALAEHEHYAVADKARLDEVQAREVAIQLGKLELTTKNQSIELLSERNRVLQLQHEVARADMWNARSGIALLALFALALAAWGWRGRRMQTALRKLAQSDPLTGVANRLHFRAQAEASLARAAQHSRPASVLMFDLDHFKRINDCFGHAAGDRLLVDVARAVQVHCRPEDVFGRLGGEEFAVLLADCDLEQARKVAQAMRESIAVIDTRALGCPLPISASFGCASTALSGSHFETLAAHADAAMYRAKTGGRNRVVVHRGAPDDAGITTSPPVVVAPDARSPRPRLQRTV
ncbi:GGDEF domain-containing protein [Cognatilysobacter bugurensis]|nr:GGDEF domain-containing protein [Lysobacter bugurensis]